MPTTLICTSAPTGLGNMGLSLALNINGIDKVILIDYSEYKFHETLAFPNSKVIFRTDLPHIMDVQSILENQVKDPARKFLFLETSWGLSEFLPKNRNYIFPMWEQPSAKLEASYCSNILSVTNHGHRFLSSLGIYNRKIEFPVNISQTFRKVTKVKNILHNAGSYGGNFRKGTPEAIEIYQKSGVESLGINLTISALKPPTDELISLVGKAPRGIDFKIGVKETWTELYEDIDLLLYPSRLEGHALPVLEAHSLGIPALCTNFSPINEYESESKYLLPIAERKEFSVMVDTSLSAKILLNLCTEPQSQKSISLRQNVEKYYSWRAMRETYECLFG